MEMDCFYSLGTDHGSYIKWLLRVRCACGNSNNEKWMSPTFRVVVECTQMSLRNQETFFRSAIRNLINHLISGKDILPTHFAILRGHCSTRLYLMVNVTLNREYTYIISNIVTQISHNIITYKSQVINSLLVGDNRLV